MKKMINETELRNRVNGLREYLAIVEQQNEDAQSAGQAIGNAIGTVGNYGKQAVNAVGNAAGAVGNAVGNAASAVGNAASGAVQGVKNFAGGVAQGAQQAYAGQPAGGAGASPTKPAAKSDPAVMKIQQDLIAKGAKIKADGIMGPATQAAQKQFAAAPAAAAPAAAPAGDAAKNPVGTTNAATAIPTGGLENPANQAKPAATPAAAPAGAPANVTAQGSEFGTDATFAKPEATPATGQAAQKRVYNGPRDTVGHMATAPAAAPAAFDPTGKTPAEIQDARNKGLIDESTSNHVVFGQEESLARIISLARG